MQQETRHLGTFAVVGHVDHGKTSLVHRLTGVNTDRLPEEQQRARSIELGYADLDLPSGGKVSVIDVPGHERLVRTMIAGSAGLSGFILAVAANRGVQAQTEEHVAILGGLGIDCGLVVITKCDLVDADQVAIVSEACAGLVPGLPQIKVSLSDPSAPSSLRNGVDRLVRTNRQGPRGSSGPARLHVDRAFSLRGIGTVITGTLQQGSIRVGDELVIVPGGKKTRARSLQVHSQSVSIGRPGQRLAINLAGLARDAISPGDVVSSRAANLSASYRLDIAAVASSGRFDLSGRVTVHHGTRAASARSISLNDEHTLAQLRLDNPLIAEVNDRLIIRSVSVPRTVEGGVVLDSAPPRHGLGTDTDRLFAIRDRRLDWPPSQPGPASEETKQPSPQQAINPDPMSEEICRTVLADTSTPIAAAATARLLDLELARVTTALEALVNNGYLVEIAPALYFRRDDFERVQASVIEMARAAGDVHLGEVRTTLGISRRYAAALLATLDRRGVTRREGDHRILRRPYRAVV